MPQFARQSSRPLSPASYLAAARKLRKFADDIERRAVPIEPREKAALTRTIYGLSMFARSLSERHRRQVDSLYDQHRADAYDAAQDTRDD